jgi:hypothetical protein
LGFAFCRLNVLSFWEERTKETLRPDFLALNRLQENRAREGTRLLALERRGEVGRAFGAAGSVRHSGDAGSHRALARSRCGVLGAARGAAFLAVDLFLDLNMFVLWFSFLSIWVHFLL